MLDDAEDRLEELMLLVEDGVATCRGSSSDK